VNYNVDDAGRTNKVYAGTVNYADMTAAGINDPFYADGRIRQLKLGNGLYETHDYRTPGTPTVYKLGTAVGNDSLTGIEYDFHPATNNGNVWKQRIIRPQFSVGQEYGYDALNRISSMYESADVNRTYGYDRYGNRYVATSSSQIPPPIAPEPTLPGHYNAANNRLVMSGTGFDAAGNQTTLAPYTLEYDAEGRNTVVKLSGASYATFSYDGEGRRVKKAMNGGDTTYYLYDALGQMAVEYSTETPSSTGPSYLFTDMLGSVRTITNNVGAVVECYDYLPFGRMLGDDVGGRGTCYPDPPDVNYDSRAPQKFTGKERDAETGLDYFLARYYSGAQGRFLSPDEFKGGPDDALSGRDITPPGPLPYADIGNPQSLNKYTYVLNNPLKYTDPDGHFWDTVLDVVGVGYDIYDLATSPSWGKAGTLGLDVVLAAVPFVPTVGGVKAGMKLADKADDLLDATKAADKGADAVRYGSKGKPDHQAKVEKLVEKATGEAQSGEQVLRERKVQNLDSNP
jgi:RHS repeat-associated protein